MMFASLALQEVLSHYWANIGPIHSQIIANIGPLFLANLSPVARLPIQKVLCTEIDPSLNGASS